MAAIRAPASCRATLAAVALSLSLPACYLDEEHDLPNDAVWTSAHFAYHTRAGEQSVCEDLMATLEQHFASIQAMFAFEWPAGRTIHYYKFASRDDFAANSPCPAGSAACTDRNCVYGYGAFEQHELVHAYFWPFGLPPPVITEGTAVALVCSRPIPEMPPLSLADAMRVHDPLSDQRVYDTGARLVRYLIGAYGPEAFLRFYPQLGLSASLEDLDRSLRSVFGHGVEEIWAATLATRANCPPPFACSLESVLRDGTSSQLAPTCGLSSESRTFDLGWEGDVAILGPASISIGSCDAIAFPTLRATSAGADTRQTVLVHLAPGHYYVESRVAQPTEVGLFAPATPWAGVDCSGLEPLLLAAGEQSDVHVLIPPGASSWAVKLRFDELRKFTVRWPADTELSVCTDCSLERCQTLRSSSRRWDVSWQGDYVLRVNRPAQGETGVIDLLGQ